MALVLVVAAGDGEQSSLALRT